MRNSRLIERLAKSRRFIMKMRLLSLLLVCCAIAQVTPVHSFQARAGRRNKTARNQSKNVDMNAVKDVHSYSNPQEIRVRQLDLDLTVDFPAKVLRGTAILGFERVAQGSRAPIILDTRALVISKVEASGDGKTFTETQFALGPTDAVLGAPLTIQLPAGADRVRINYETSPGASGLQWLDPQQTAGKRYPFIFTQSEAIHARSWIPTQDTPHVRVTYTARVHTPPELLAVMSAENDSRTPRDGDYSFSMTQPIPSYLIALAVGDLRFRSLGRRTGVYAEPPVIDKAASEFADTEKMVAATEKLYGPYRWGRYDLLVLPPSFPYGGMENPRLTFLTPTVIAGDQSLGSLIPHELAHSWSGNLVTNATWNDFWLNEGFTTYFEHRISEQLYGREYSEMLWRLGITDAKEELATLPPQDQGLYIDLTGRNPDDAPGTVYEKGALFLRLLEETAGREKWDRFLRAYFDTHVFQPMTTTRFTEYLRNALPDVVKRVNIDQWIYGPGIPADAPQPKSEAFARVEAQASAFAKGAPAESIDMAKWSSHEKVHFIQSLPKLYPERLETLDRRFHFSESGNSEVLSAWLEKSLDSGYKGVYPAVEVVLTTPGRRTFLK